jgi:hypothetical protein
MSLTKEEKKQKRLKRLEQKKVKQEGRIDEKANRRDWGHERWKTARGIGDVDVVRDYDAPYKSGAKEGEDRWYKKSIVHRVTPKNLKLRRIEKKIDKVKGVPSRYEDVDKKKKKPKFKLRRKKDMY